MCFTHSNFFTTVTFVYDSKITWTKLGECAESNVIFWPRRLWRTDIPEHCGGVWPRTWCVGGGSAAHQWTLRTCICSIVSSMCNSLWTAWSFNDNGYSFTKGKV